MPLFTKGLKLAAFNKRRFGSYLLYALGEIILVVAGILIALQINNSNEERKAQKTLEGVLKSVSYDLELDTLAVGNVIKYFEVRDTLSESIMLNRYSRKDFEKCLLCGTLITTFPPVKINDKGYVQLKNLVDTSAKKDTLSVEIVQFYNAFNPLLDEFGKQVKDFAIDNLKEWRDEEPWFATIRYEPRDPRFLDYLASQKYRNKVAYFNAIACKNYMFMLKAYKTQATMVLEKIEKRYPETPN